MGGGSDSPARRPGADGRCSSPVALPCTLTPGRFGRATAGYVDCPQAAMVSRHRPGTTPGPAGDRPPLRAPAGDPTPITLVKLQQSTGEIDSLNRDPGIATLVPGMQFPGN